MNFKVRDEVLTVKKYVPGKPIDKVKGKDNEFNIVNMASNENPLGCSKNVKEALKNALENANRYPDSASFYLKDEIAKFWGIKNSQIFCGTGSDSLVKIICDTILEKDHESIVYDLTFPRYETCIKLRGAKPIRVALKNFKVDLNDLIVAITDKTKIIWLCNPNNPTGTIFKAKELEDFLEKVPQNVYVVIDEAYGEFVNDRDYPNSINLMKKYKNIIILKTFSKAYGLASLRVGYGIADERLVDFIDRVINPFDVNAFAQVAAIEAIKDREFLKEVKEFIISQRQFMINELKKIGIDSVESHSNFILAHVGNNEGKIASYLLENGYLVREGSKLGIPKYLRISIGKENDNKNVIRLIKDILEK
ncbi:MAG: histidinol-phosphate transaminase [Clostridium perfringens]|nr:histidinol-phosphate transaminase [Clostridium perfringens]